MVCVGRLGAGQSAYYDYSCCIGCACLYQPNNNITIVIVRRKMRSSRYKLKIFMNCNVFSERHKKKTWFVSSNAVSRISGSQCVCSACVGKWGSSTLAIVESSVHWLKESQYYCLRFAHNKFKMTLSLTFYSWPL